MISRKQKMTNLWKQVRFIETVDPSNAFVRSLMEQGIYSPNFSALNEELLDWFSAITEHYSAVYTDSEHHRAVKAAIDQTYV